MAQKIIASVKSWRGEGDTFPIMPVKVTLASNKQMADYWGAFNEDGHV